MITKVIKLDINKNLYEKIKAKQGDTKSRFLLFQLLDGSMPFNLENRSVRAYMLKPDSTEVFNDLIINNRNTGHCTLELTNQVLAVAGIVKIELMIIENDKKITSSIFELQVDKSINSENSIVSTNEFNALLNGLASLSEYDNYKEKAKKVPELEENIQELGSQLEHKANNIDVKNKHYDVYEPLKTTLGLPQLEFKRKHSRNLFKNLQYRICGMDFYRDFLSGENGNMYPNLEKNSTLTEEVKDFTYTVTNKNESGASQVRRFIGAFNLYGTYDITVKNIIIDPLQSSTLGVRSGIDIVNPINDERYNVHFAFTSANTCELRSEMFIKGASQGSIVEYTINEFNLDSFRFLITCKEDKLEVYSVINKVKTYLATVTIPRKLNTIDLITRCRTSLYTRLGIRESITYTNVENYFDSGISQGDMKPVKYKNGSPIIKNGRIYYTMSSRFQTGAYQTVISQNLSGCDYKLEGVIYFITNGTVGQDLASSILYDTDTGKFLIWNTCFNNSHCLSHGESYSDILHGVNYVDMEIMGGSYNGNDEDFVAKYDDEDPDFCFNYETNKWNLIICRLVYDNEVGQNMYRYFLFESDNPFTGYTFKDKTLSGTNTGGTIVKIGDRYYLCCGSNYHITSQYNIYDLNDLSKFNSLIKDYEDGGFRGWGTIIPIPCGNYTKYGWITFDRTQAGDSTWSYGNIYYYESNLMNKGCEYKIKYNY